MTKAVADTMGQRNALYYIMTGETFTGKQAAAMGLVNESVPADQLEKRVRELAKVLMGKDPVGDGKGIVIAQHDLLDEAGRLVFSCLTRSVFAR